MGYAVRYTPTKEEIEAARKQREELDKKKYQDLQRLAMKLATIAVDNIITDIVRPGPKPEERECYDVANEIRQFQPVIIDQIVKALIVESSEGKVVKSEYHWMEGEPPKVLEQE